LPLARSFLKGSSMSAVARKNRRWAGKKKRNWLWNRNKKHNVYQSDDCGKGARRIGRKKKTKRSPVMGRKEA